MPRSLYETVYAPAGGVDTFLELTDTPSAFAGQGLLGLRVNAGETAIEFYSTAEADTLQIVTDRGAITDNLITTAGISSDGASTFNESGNDVDFRIEGSTEDVLTIDAGLNSIDWSSGNTWYLGINEDIETFIASATCISGDTIVLAAGEYVVTNTLTVAKKVHIQGQGEGITTISCAANVHMLSLTTQDGILISDLTLNQSGVKTASRRMILTAVDTDMENVEFIDTSTGGSYAPTGLRVEVSDKTFNLRNCEYTGSGITGCHLFVSLNGNSTVNMYDCYSISSDGTAANLGNILVYAVQGAINIYGGSYSSATVSTGGVIQCEGCSINCYGSTLNGSGAGAFDVKRTAGTLTLYNTTLVNGTTSGRITYGGTITGAGLDLGDNFDVDASTGIASGKAFATQNTHHEIGVYLDILTTPRIILGLTGTMANTSTETGYESGAGRTWTYHNTNTADKITQGNTYAIDMDGTADYLSTPDTADLSFDDSGNNPFSIGGWVEVVATALGQYIVSKYKRTTGSEAREWYVSVEADEKIRFVLYDETNNKAAYVRTDSVLSEGWHFVVATYDSTGGGTAANGLTLYVDGVAVASTATTIAGYVCMRDTGASVLVGADIEAGGSAGAFFQGNIGRVFVTAEELSAANVHRLYEKTRGFYNI